MATNGLTSHITAAVLAAVIIAALGGLATYGAVNSTVADHSTKIAGLEQRERERQQRDSDTAQRVVAIETKLDFLIQYFGLTPPARRTTAAPP